MIFGDVSKSGYKYYPYPDNIRPDTDPFILKFAYPNPDPILSRRIRIRIWANPYPFYPFDTPSPNKGFWTCLSPFEGLIGAFSGIDMNPT